MKSVQKVRYIVTEREIYRIIVQGGNQLYNFNYS